MHPAYQEYIAKKINLTHFNVDHEFSHLDNRRYFFFD